MSSFDKYLDELYFYMKEFYDFETKFRMNLPQNYIYGDIACLVDTEEIDNWKSNIDYENCLEFLENHDKINFDKKQIELNKHNTVFHKINLKAYETLDEVCNSLKHNKRISIISHQFFCYLNKITYTPTVFNFYTKNNQLIIYFGTGKSLFFPNYDPDKKLESENVYIIDLPQNKQSFIESIFKTQNMSDSFNGDKNLSLSMNTLLNYTINKNSIKRNNSYNFYSNKENNYSDINIPKNNQIDNININNGNYINYNNNSNPDISNKINIKTKYQKIITTDKPFIKDNNENELVEEYQNSQNKIVTNNEIEKSQENNQDLFINNKNDEYNKGYKNSYKDKEIEYEEILKEKNYNIDNEKNKEINKNIDNKENSIENENNNNLNNDIKYNNVKEIQNINFENKFINNHEINPEKKENEIKQEINNYELNINNINNDIEGYNTIKRNNIKNEDNNLNIDRDNEDIKDKNFEIDIKEKDEKEINFNIPDGNNINDNIKNSINNIQVDITNIKNNLNNIKVDSSNENFQVDNNIIIDDKKDKSQKVGLDNINGKSSFINAAIQCLSYTIPLTNYFLNEENRDRIIKNNISISNPNGPQLSPSYLNILENLWINKGNLKSFSPTEFVKNIKYLNKSFEKEEENDVGDLIIFILEQLDSELNDKKEIENNNNELNNESNIIKNNFYKELLKHNSIIYKTFFGGVCEILMECQKCNEESNLKKTENKKILEYHNLNYFKFPINEVFLTTQQNNKKDFINLYDCLNYFQTAIILDGENGKFCEKCGKLTSFFKISRINACQNNLLFLLNRDFEKEKNVKFKFDEILDITEYVQEKKGKLIYDLYAVISLCENKDIHYVSFCKNLSENSWYKFDDCNVEIVNNLENDIFNFGNPVALFYQQKQNLDEN